MVLVGLRQANKVWQPPNDNSSSVGSSFTTSVWNKPRVLQEPSSPLLEGRTTSTPSLKGSDKPSPPELLLTPVGTLSRSSTCATTSKSMMRVSSRPSPSPSSLNSRRMQRYRHAEKDLSSKFLQCNTELSPRELQIRALERATAILTAHAHDSRQRAEKLRRVLVDRSLDPTAYEKLKHERWMEERRHVVVDLDKKIALEQLHFLLSQPGDQPPVTCPAESDHYGTASDLKRSHINLSKFFKSSLAHPPVLISKSPLVYSRRSINKRTLTKTCSLRLRVTSPIRPHFKPDKEELKNSAVNHTKQGSGLLNPEQLRSSIFMSPNSADRNADSFSLSEKSSRSASSRDSTQHQAPLTPPTSASSLTPPILHSNNTDSSDLFDGGTAIIYRPRSSLPLVINKEEITVEIPDYALDLFSGFDNNCLVPKPLLGPAPGEMIALSSSPKSSPRKTESRNSMPALRKVQPPSSSMIDAEKKSKLVRASSHHHLTTLFSIPEALSSDNVDRNDSRLRSRSPEGGDLSGSGPSRSVSSFGGTISKEAFSAKLKKRLSNFRLGRS